MQHFLCIACDAMPNLTTGELAATVQNLLGQSFKVYPSPNQPSGIFNVDHSVKGAVRIGEPLYMTMSGTRTFLSAYIYLGSKYAVPGAVPDADELPVYEMDSRKSRVFGRY